MSTTEAAVWAALAEVRAQNISGSMAFTHDLEDLSIVDVGMVEQVTLERNGCSVRIAIIMFNRARLYIDRAASPIRSAVLALPGVKEVAVEVLWDRQWSPERLSAAARHYLGFVESDGPAGSLHSVASERASPDDEPADRRLLPAAPALAPCATAVEGWVEAELCREHFSAWSGWRRFQRLSVTEPAGLKRTEPLFSPWLALRVYDDAAREVRVVDEDTAEEIPCQVLYRPTTTSKLPAAATAAQVCHCRVVFACSLLPHQLRRLIILYDNPSPGCWEPLYPTDLVVRGTGVGLEIANSHYTVRLSPLCGQLRELNFAGSGLRLGCDRAPASSRIDASNDPGSDIDIGWHGEDECLHWGPDFRNQLRYRMTNWASLTQGDDEDAKLAPRYTVEQGPLCVVVRRWGYPSCPFSPAREQNAASIDVTYTFFASKPHFLVENAIRVEQPVDMLGVRNDQFVFFASAETPLFSTAFSMADALGSPVIEYDASAAGWGKSFEEEGNPALLGFCGGPGDIGSGDDAFASLRLAYDAKGFLGAFDPIDNTMGRPETVFRGDLTRPDYRIELWARGAWNSPGVRNNPHTTTQIAAGAFVSETNALLCYQPAAPGASGGRHGQAAELYRRLRQPPLQEIVVGVELARL